MTNDTKTLKTQLEGAQSHKIGFRRLGVEPLLEPNIHAAWEAGGIFAPAVVRDNKLWRMIFRAYGRDNISRLGYAESQDGLVWNKMSRPVVSPLPHDNQEKYGVEDSRITKIGRKYYITYTAATNTLFQASRRWKTRIRILETTNFKQFKRIKPRLPAVDNKDAVLFPRQINGQYYMLHRMMPDIWLSHGADLVHWRGHSIIMQPGQEAWERTRIGAGAPPLETSIGWLLLYHGVDVDNKYSMSAAVLDINDPTIVRYRLPYPLIVPETCYERRGVIPNVVFGTSLLEQDHDYWLYYGAADTCIAAAAINKHELLEELQNYPVG